MIFIRHAEPDKDGNLTAEGTAQASKLKLPYGSAYVSELPRSLQTMKAALPHRHDFMVVILAGLNEWDKTRETADQFKIRVARTLKKLPEDAIVFGHARWMTWAHWLLKSEVALGFDYLESFEA